MGSEGWGPGASGPPGCAVLVSEGDAGTMSPQGRAPQTQEGHQMQESQHASTVLALAPGAHGDERKSTGEES